MSNENAEKSTSNAKSSVAESVEKVYNYFIYLYGGRTSMDVSYKRLWKLLIDKDMTKKNLAEKAGLSQYAINKLNRNDNVTVETLVKVCRALDCTVDDIMEILPAAQ